MNKKIVVAAALVTITAAISAFSVLSSEVALFERFPDIDPDVVVKAHRIMVRRTLTAQYANIDMTDEKCDEIFLAIVKEITK